MSTDTGQTSSAGAVAQAAPPTKGWSPRAFDLANRFAMIGVLIALVIAARIAYPGFLESGNIKNTLANVAPVGLVAIGMTFVLIGGGFDLSVSGIFALSGVLYATYANAMPVGLAFLLMVPTAIAMGIANGLVITRLNVNAFVATLGSASIFSGLAFVINKTGAVFVEKESFMYLGTAHWFGIPVMIWILAFAFVVGWFLLSKTVYGRSVFLVGGNAEAARLAGLRVSVIQASTYALTALCAGIAGMLLTSQTGVGQANVGTNITLDSIAIVIIGGTSLRGGQGAMWRTLVGLLIIATIDSLFNSLAWNSSVQSITKGAIVIGAVALDAWTQKRRSAA
jgi:ribose transport system permease protein